MILQPQQRLAVEGRFSSSRELGPRSDFVCWSCIIKVERRRFARRSHTCDWKHTLFSFLTRHLGWFVRFRGREAGKKLHLNCLLLRQRDSLCVERLRRPDALHSRYFFCFFSSMSENMSVCLPLSKLGALPLPLITNAGALLHMCLAVPGD